jgi:hypothetical protein
MSYFFINLNSAFADQCIDSNKNDPDSVESIVKRKKAKVD